MPRRAYVWAYEHVLPLTYRFLGSDSSGIGSGIDESHFFIREVVQPDTPVLFAVARRPAHPNPVHGSAMTKVWVTVPTLNEVENLDHAGAAHPRRGRRRAHPHRRRRQRRRHRRQGRSARRRARRHRGAAPAAQDGPRQRVPRRPRDRHRPRLRRHGPDRRRPLARSGRAPRACSPRSSGAPTSRSAPATCPAARCPNWPKRRLLLSVWGNRYAGFALGLRRPRLHCGLPRVPRVDPARDGHRVDALDRLRVPDRDDLPRVPRRRADRGSPDHVHRPRARHLEDVEHASSPRR